MLTFTTNLALHQTPRARVDFHNTVVTESGLDMDRAEFTNAIESVLDNVTDGLKRETADYKARTLVRKLEWYIASPESWPTEYPEDTEWGTWPWDMPPAFISEAEYNAVTEVLADYGAVYKINDELVYAVPYKMGLAVTTLKSSYDIAPLDKANETNEGTRDFAQTYGDDSGGVKKMKEAEKALRFNARWNEPKPQAEVKAPKPAPKATPKLDALFTKLASF